MSDQTAVFSPRTEGSAVRERILLSEIDIERYNDVPTTGRRQQPDAWIGVHDLATGEPAWLRRSPCGLGCKCDMEIRRTPPQT